MDNGTIALILVCALWAVFLAWAWNAQAFARNAHKIHVTLHEMLDMERDNYDLLGRRFEELREKHNRLGNDYETTASHAKSGLAMGEALMDGFRELRDRIEALEKATGMEAQDGQD